MLVEDDGLVRGALKLVLEWEGYSVSCAGNGREALDLLRTGRPPSCILLDLGLPVPDGWAFRREQQRDPALAPIPVVVVSALAAAETLDAAGHVQKPFQPEQLLEALQGLVAGQPTGNR